jgi:hypothetical protein
MFRGLINDAKAAAGSLVGKYLMRASVAVPFIVAIGFGVAALTVVLVEKFGSLYAYLMVAGGFTLIGLVAAVAVNVKEQEEEIAENRAEAGDTKAVATDAAAQAAAQAPLALLGALLASPAGPSALAGGAKMMARNIPLVVLLALIAMLFWPLDGKTQERPADAEPDEPRPGKPNGAHAPAPNGLHREAA